MASWSYVEEEKGYLFSDEMDFSVDGFMRSRKALIEWDNKGSCNFERDEFASDREVILEFVAKEGQQSMEFEISSCELDSSNSSKRGNSSTNVIALVSSSGDEVSESKHLGSLVESKTHASALIDLKLANCQGASNDKIAEEGFTLSSIHPTMLAKRARDSCSPIRPSVCQVYGCNIDLSSSKEYHKRHKVCDVHSKTPKVIVNGIQQRFCQQCSRFHLLAEFDDGKRSCRRRLAGHNERRRKQQFDYMSSKQHKIYHSFEGLSGCALSLLSAQSSNPSRHSAENLSPSSLILQGICLQNREDQVSKTPLGINSVDKYVPTKLFQCWMNSKDDITSRSSILSEDNCQPSALCDIEYRHSYEHGTTVDLFQLSSNLQRVEQQRNSLIKSENEFCFPTV